MRRSTGLLLAVATFGVTIGTVGPTPVPAAPPASGTFTRVDATALGGEQSVFAEVVSDGRGVYHSVVRDESAIGQFIRYQRSSNGGRSWVLGGMFKGPNGGATKPHVAVDGDHVSIAFIGSRCETFVSCTEVPMLVASHNSGGSWTSPQVLSPNFAGDIDVTQEGPRAWVAWERGGISSLRATSDGGGTFSTSAELSGDAPQLSAGGDLVTVSTRSWAGSGFATLMALARNGLVGPQRQVAGLPYGTATADGHGHTVLLDNRKVSVATITESSGLNNNPVVEVLDAGNVAAPSIDARTGLLAVGWTVRPDDGSTATALVASSIDNASTFGPPSVVGVQANGGDLATLVSIAERVASGPIARIDYSVADKYVDGVDADALPEPANALDNPGLDRILVEAELDVTIDGCATTAAPTRTIAADAYRWTFDGVEQPEQGCTFMRDMQPDEAIEVVLQVTDSAGDVGTTDLLVRANDILMVSIGDSIASGEGNPHLPGIFGSGGYNSETWQDHACHRSALAGPALAARQLEASDDRSAVTFIQLACSGAAIMDTPEVPGDPVNGLDPDTGGLLDAYRGIESPTGLVKPSQLDQLAATTTRPVDVMAVSIGANDVRFSTIVEECITTTPGAYLDGCHEGTTKTDFDTRLAELPARYAALDARFDAMGIVSSNVFITEYMDLTEDETGEADLRCIGDELLAAVGFLGSYVPFLGEAIDLLIAVVLATGLVTADEADFAKNYVVTKLNQAVAAGAAANDWNLVGDIARRFARHGYCSDENWIVQLGQSAIAQNDPFGAFHPNNQGHKIFGDALAARIIDSLLVGSEADSGPLGADQIGDVYALTHGDGRIVATALRDTGGSLVNVGARQLVTVDTSIDPTARAVPTSPIAADTLSAVATWNEGWQTWHFIRAYAAPVGLVDNISVLGARLVQAPADSLQLLRDRPMLVAATVTANVSQATTVSVHTVIEDDIGTLADVTETVLVQPGQQDLVLPSATVTSGGTTARATVTISPLPDEPAKLHDDNSASTPDYTVTEGRSASVTFVPAAISGGGGVSCADAAQSASVYGQYATDALPVVSLDTDIACTPTSPIGLTSAALVDALVELDQFARLTGRDAVIAIVPSGWLQAVADGAVGIAAPGIRAAIVERGKSAAVAAHELNHTFGFDHIETPAIGVRVSNRTVISGWDWMAPTEVQRPWTSGVTWEATKAALGGPSDEPQPSLFGPDRQTIRGRFVRNPDGSWTYQRGESGPSGEGGTDPDLEDLELERLIVRQTDGVGDTTDTAVGLAPVSSLQAAGAGEAVQQGLAFSVDLTLVSNLSTIEVVFDGEVVDTIFAGATPTVTVTAPASGAVVGSEDDVTVEWVMSSPDLSSTILLSPDGGVSWQPVASGVFGESFTFPSPEDVDSDNVVLRVIVSDGVRFGWDDSDTFAGRASLVTSPARVVFVRITPTPFVPPVPIVPGTPSAFGSPGAGLTTMNPDGTDVRELVPYVLPDPFVASGPMRPSWNADGTMVGFDAATSPTTRSSFIINADGTGLRQLTTGHTVCAVVSPNGARILVLEKSTFMESAALMKAIDATTGAVVQTYTFASYRYGDEPREHCPRYSPDGKYILFRYHQYLQPPRMAVLDATTGGLVYPLSTDYQGEWSGLAPAWNLDGSRFGSTGWAAMQPWIVDFASRTYAATVILSPGVYAGTIGFVDNDTAYVGTVPTPWELGRYCTLPFSAHTSDDQDATCYVPDGSGVAVAPYGPLPSPTPDGVFNPDLYRGTSEAQPGSGPVVIPPVSAVPADAGGPYAGAAGSTITFDAGASTALTPDSSVEWDLDGDGDFDDAVGVRPFVGFPEPGSWQVRVRVTPPVGGGVVSAAVALNVSPLPEVTGEAPDESADPALAGPADVEMVAPQGSTTSVMLVDTDGVPGQFVVDTGPADGKVVVSVPEIGSPWESFGSGSDGQLLVTPVAGFLGTVELPISALPERGGGTAVLRITVTGNRAPITVDDELTLPAGVVSQLSPDVLLGNDSDPDVLVGVRAQAVDGLALAGVSSLTNGEAWLGVDGQVYVQPAESGPGSFTYRAIDAEGGTSTGTARFTAIADEPTPATAPPTTAPPTAPTTATAPPTTAPPTTAPPTTAPPVVQPPFSGRIPETGNDAADTMWTALTMLAAGVVLVTVVRRRRGRPLRR